MDKDDLLSVPEAATQAGVADATIWRWIRDGLVPTYRFRGKGARTRIHPDDLAKVLAPVQSVDGAA